MINEGYVRAQRWFADANGWRVAGHGFSLEVFARNGMRGGWNYSTAINPVDHVEHYRKDRRAVAIVGHNYDGEYGTHYGIENITAYAAEHGLIVHVPPAGKAASWYYPNGTIPLVVTRPGTAIVWPTAGQMTATAQAYADYATRSRERWDAARELRASTPPQL
jgi:hypothetical protein